MCHYTEGVLSVCLSTTPEPVSLPDISSISWRSLFSSISRFLLIITYRSYIGKYILYNVSEYLTHFSRLRKQRQDSPLGAKRRSIYDILAIISDLLVSKNYTAVVKSNSAITIALQQRHFVSYLHRRSAASAAPTAGADTNLRTYASPSYVT